MRVGAGGKFGSRRSSSRARRRNLVARRTRPFGTAAKRGAREIKWDAVLNRGFFFLNRFFDRGGGGLGDFGDGGPLAGAAHAHPSGDDEDRQREGGHCHVMGVAEGGQSRTG